MKFQNGSNTSQFRYFMEHRTLRELTHRARWPFFLDAALRSCCWCPHHQHVCILHCFTKMELWLWLTVYNFYSSIIFWNFPCMFSNLTQSQVCSVFLPFFPENNPDVDLSCLQLYIISNLLSQFLSLSEEQSAHETVWCGTQVNENIQSKRFTNSTEIFNHIAVLQEKC